MADHVSGELVIVPDAEEIATITANEYFWQDAIDFAAAYTNGINSDYRLITKAEAVAILGNSLLVGQLGLPDFSNYWTIEATADPASSYYCTPAGVIDGENATEVAYYALPIRKVNFYGLPLIESEYGEDGFVYDVVAETRTVHIVAKWSRVIAVINYPFNSWDAAMALFPITLDNIFTSMPTRAQALKIFGNSYLVTLAGLPLDRDYWTSESVGGGGAWYFDRNTLSASIDQTGSLYYRLPVRSEVVPET